MTDPRRDAILQLKLALGLELIAEVAESEPVLVVAGNPEDGTRTLTVRCDPRASDGDRLWFWLDHGQAAKPLIEASNVTDAVVLICGERRIRETPGVLELMARARILDNRERRTAEGQP